VSHNEQLPHPGRVRVVAQRAEGRFCCETGFSGSKITLGWLTGRHSRDPDNRASACYIPLIWFWPLEAFMVKAVFRVLMLGLAFSLMTATGRAQDLVKEALASFPLDTVRLEYSSPAKLRNLPDYATLRRRYLAPGLRSLEAQLASLGIQESDINEVVLGWAPSGEKLGLEGVAEGRFDPQAMARRAAAAGISSTPVGSVAAYCFGDSGVSPCVTALGRSLGALGTLTELQAVMDARSGQAMSLGSKQSFDALVEQAHKDTPIWGVAIGQAVPDWFKGSMPAQKNLQLDWSTTFKSVESLTYSVQPADQIRLNVQMNCVSDQGAGDLRRVFDGLRLLQKMAWQNQYPNVPNPFDNLVVDASGRAVLLTLITPYSALEANATQ